MGCAGSTVCCNNSVDDGVTPQFITIDQFDRGTSSLCSTKALPASSSSAEDIAIVGIGCRTPGADNIREFWSLLKNGECHITDVPADRWDATAYLDTDRMAHGKAYVQKGGFIKDLENFDNGLYGINDFEASQMDLQQCLLLDCTSMALQDAGIPWQRISGSNTGVYVGAMNCDYHGANAGINSKASNYTSTGTSNSILANRLSYVFNLTGPSMMLDTACSASMIAIHQGCQAIRAGDCDMAVCGGVNAITMPEMYIHLSKARMISPTGLCHTFSDKADGYTRGEGCGMVVLKRLDDALRDDDKVWATVYTGTNQDGRTVSPLTAPSGSQQEKLLHCVYDKFQVDVNHVDYVEAHGTGTPLGDPIETNALGQFFKGKGNPRDRYIGSVKTNIGHTESSAGVLSVIKVLLMMKHNVIVPSLHCNVVSPKIDLASLRFKIPDKLVPWPNEQKIAVCNSFGFGGSNSHTILKSPKKEESSRDHPKSSCIVCFSGRNLRSLKGSLEDLYGDEDVALLNVRDVAYTSTIRRDHHPYRAAFIVSDMQDLLADVGERLANDKWPSASRNELNLVYVFCGMGTAWEGMCRELMADNEAFKATMTEIDKHLSSYVDWSLMERLQKEDPCRDPILAPIAIFACQAGLVNVWNSLGIKPSCVVGQSVGEVAAAYCAGCLSLADAVRIIYQRSQLLAKLSGGAMIIVQNAEVSKVREVVEGLDKKASVSLQYSPTACAISAAAENMTDIRQQLLSKLRQSYRSIKVIDLDVSVAYHSSHVDPCLENLVKSLNGLAATSPKTQLISSVTGSNVSTQVDAQYWADNVRKPVLFGQAVTQAVGKKGTERTIFLELGPKPVLTAHLKDLFPDKSITAVPSIRQQAEHKSFLSAVVSLYEHGLNIAWGNLPSGGTEVTSVPRYAFDKKNIRVKTETEVMIQGGHDMYHSNHLYANPVLGKSSSYRLLISPLNVPSIYDHVLSGKILVPGAFYVEAGLAIAKYCGRKYPFSLGVEFQQPLLLERDDVLDLQAELESGEEGKSLCLIKKKLRQLATLQILGPSMTPSEIVNIDHIRARCNVEMSKKEIYNNLNQFGFEYGSAFSLIDHAYKNSDECLAVLKVNDTVQKEMPCTVLHPSIIDCILQSSIIVMTDEAGKKDVLPKSIGRLAVHGTAESQMIIYTRLRCKTSKSLIFEQQLLSPAGHIIADVQEFTLQILTANSGTSSLPPLITASWYKMLEVSELKLQETKGNDKDVIVISDSNSINTTNSISLTINGHIHQSKMSEQIKKTIEVHKTAEAVVVVVGRDLTTESDSDVVHAHVLNMCCVVQTALKTIVDLTLQTPLYLCTFSAWEGLDTGVTVNPAATAMWGLLRTVVMETADHRVTAVELQSFQELPLQTVFHFLNKAKKIQDYPEVLIAHSGVFINKIALISDMKTLPQQRRDVKTVVSHLDGSVVILTEEPSTLDTPVAVRVDRISQSYVTETRKLKVSQFAQPDKKLLKLVVQSSTLLPERTAADYVVMALEVTGQTEDGSGQEWTSCCPCNVGPELFVPVDTMLPTAVLPQYQAGDLSKLVLLWEMCSRVSSDSVTILGTPGTQGLASVMKEVLSTSENNHKVDIIGLEKTDLSISLGETVISLIYLDSSTVSSLLVSLQRVKYFFTLSQLISQEALSVLICALPGVEPFVLNTQLLYQQKKIEKIVPKIWTWFTANQARHSDIASALHLSSNVDTSCLDARKLLEFKGVGLAEFSVVLEQSRLFRKEAAYVVVGGLTGLGWLCVEFLAQNNAGHIAIINRRSPTSQQENNMNVLSRSCGCRVQAYQADITQMTSVADAFKRLQQEAGDCRLRGVFMGAAVLEDGFFTTMQMVSFDKVLAPKVKGAWNLHLLTKELPLDYFVLHSSVASVLGNLGQANYSAGNAFLDGLAFYRRGLGLAAQTINWGPLDTGLLDNQDDVRRKLQAMGFHFATHGEIKNTFESLLMLNWTQAVPVKINPDLYGRRLYKSNFQPLVRRMQQIISQPQQLSSSETDTEVNAAKIKLLEGDAKRQAYENYIRGLAGRVLGIEVDRIPSDASLMDLGLDSVTSMIMINLIHRDTSFKLAAVDLISGKATITSLATALARCTNEAC